MKPWTSARLGPSALVPEELATRVEAAMGSRQWLRRSSAVRPRTMALRALGGAAAVAASLVLLGGAASAQAFTIGTGLPAGTNPGYTENCEFGDVDLDGDPDVAKAEGGIFGNEQNQLWLNAGGAQGGVVGTFQD